MYFYLSSNACPVLGTEGTVAPLRTFTVQWGGSELGRRTCQELCNLPSQEGRREDFLEGETSTLKLKLE